MKGYHVVVVLLEDAPSHLAYYGGGTGIGGTCTSFWGGPDIALRLGFFQAALVALTHKAWIVPCS